jgi:hypothetical protein
MTVALQRRLFEAGAASASSAAARRPRLDGSGTEDGVVGAPEGSGGSPGGSGGPLGSPGGGGSRGHQSVGGGSNAGGSGGPPPPFGSKKIAGSGVASVDAGPNKIEGF